VGFLSSGSGTANGNLYLKLKNTSGAPVTGVPISYNVEKYRGGTNTAGFRILLYYSFNGSTWTSAGAPFLTYFPGDANNNGYASAPGATVPVAGTLGVTVPDGSDLYLAWNYSVSTASTTTNAQALAIDDIDIGGVGSTSPFGSGAASPPNVAAGASSLLTVTVTGGSNPGSTGLAVTADLVAIGGSPAQAFVDNGSNGDLAAGDNIFSYQATVPAGTAAGTKSLPVTITDAQGRTGSTSISLTIDAPLVAIHDIQGSGDSSPFAGQQVATTGIVTGANTASGFFIQAPDTDVDNDPATSEGLFVYTGKNNIPNGAVVGNLVRLSGTVQEYGSQTEISGVSTVTVLSTGQHVAGRCPPDAGERRPSERNHPGRAFRRNEGGGRRADGCRADGLRDVLRCVPRCRPAVPRAWTGSDSFGAARHAGRRAALRRQS
jgi:hypothetical protein